MKTISIILVFLAASTASAQQPASHVYGSVNLTAAKQLGYKQPGVGGGIGGSFNLPRGFVLRDDFEVVSERKTFESSGRTVANVAALRWYTPATSNGPMQNKALFAEAGLQTASHTNLPSVTRLQLGGGVHVLNQTSLMPVVEVSAKLVKALKDGHGLNGLKAGAASYHNFARSPFGVFVAGDVSYGRFHDVGTAKKRNAVYAEFRIGFFVNLSAIAGA